MKKTAKLLSAACALSMTFSALALSLTATAAEKNYPTIAKIYDAERFLSDDTKPAKAPDNTEQFMGVAQSPLLGGSKLDAKEKKEGKSSLMQKSNMGGADLTFWACGIEKFDNKLIDISGCANPGVSMWLYVSDPKAIGGDVSSSNDEYGSIIMDLGSGSGTSGAQRDDERLAWWINADKLKKGWNKIIVPIDNGTYNDEDKTVTQDGVTYGFDKKGTVKLNQIDWWRLIIKSKNALSVRIDDVKFVDLGKKPVTPPPTSSKAPKPDSSTAAKPDSSTAAKPDSSTATQPSSTTDSSEINSDVSSDVTTESNISDTSSEETSSAANAGGEVSDDDEGGTNVLLIVGIILAVIALGGGGFAVYWFVIKPKAAK